MWASGCVLADLTWLCNQRWHLLHHSDSSYKHIVMSFCSTDKFCEFCYHDHLFCFCYRDNSLLLPWILYYFSSPSLSSSARQDRVGAMWHKQPPQVHRPAHQPDAAQNQQNQQGGPSFHYLPLMAFIQISFQVIFSFSFNILSRFLSDCPFFPLVCFGYREKYQCWV